MDDPWREETYRIVNDALDGHQYPEARHFDVLLLLTV